MGVIFGGIDYNYCKEFAANPHKFDGLFPKIGHTLDDSGIGALTFRLVCQSRWWVKVWWPVFAGKRLEAF